MADNKELTPAQQIAALKEQLAKVSEESAAKDAIISTQDEQLAAANAQGSAALSVVTHEKQRYQVLAGQFSLDDKVIQHHELKGNPELVKKIVEQYPGLVQLLDEPKKDEAK